MHLGLGLTLHRPGVINLAPTDIALSAASVAENAELGAVIGTLSGTDPEGGALTFTLADDADGYFGVDGTDLIVTGVLDFETAASHNITVRATDSGGGFFDEVFAITVTDVDESFASEDDELPDDGEVDDDGTFTNPPVVTVVDGAIKLHGKKASGSTGKFIYDIGPFAAGRKYTMLYDPDFSLMTLTGTKALVGFGLKQGLDFRLTGLKGDGGAGLNAYEISGDGLWNATSGFTEDDGGAAQNGTQAGPNWLQIEVAEDGSTYTLRTSADGESWDDEFTDVTPSPLTETTDATQGGIAVFFDGTDTGSFSVAITLWISADVELALDGISGLTGAWSMSRDLLTSFIGSPRYTNSGSTLTNLSDQSGASRTFTTPSTDPTIVTAGPLSRTAAAIASGQLLQTAAGDPLSDFVTASAGYIIVSGIFTTLTANQANPWQNHPLVGDNGGFMAITGKTGSLALGFNWDGTADSVSVGSVSAGTAYVFEWRHEGGTLGLRVNGGTEATTLSGNTSTLTSTLSLGGDGTGTSIPFDGVVFEAACFSTVPSLSERDALAANFKAWIGA